MKKIKLKDLKVKSFVTEIEKQDKLTLKGGINTNGKLCNLGSLDPTCQTNCFYCGK